MKETLQKLRNIEPSDDTMRAIKLRVDARVKEMKPNHKRITSPYFAFSSKVSLFLVPAMAFSFLFVFGLYSNGHLGNTRLAIQLAQANNAHEKSQLALSKLKTDAHGVELALLDTQSIRTLSGSIDRTTDVLNELQLMGEPGKYSLEECLSDYHNYYEELERIEAILDNAPYPTNIEDIQSRNALLSKVEKAMEQAEVRIGKYPETPAE